MAINRREVEEAFQLLGWLDTSRNTHGSLPPMIDMIDMEIRSILKKTKKPDFLKKIADGSRMNFDEITDFSFAILAKI